MSKDDKEGRVEEAFYTKMGVEVTGIGAAIKVIELNATTHTCVCLNGESGIGKTHIVRQVAAAREVTKDF
ncbi:hypothetical protein KJ782_07255, partial [Patescibacteria group bacterium]|nr:hypothetical protein [Patescibacteria group bacterium]